MKHIVESVAFISELVPIGPESLEKKNRDKISLYVKANNYGIILAEKEKEGLAFDVFCFFFFPAVPVEAAPHTTSCYFGTAICTW